MRKAFLRQEHELIFKFQNLFKNFSKSIQFFTLLTSTRSVAHKIRERERETKHKWSGIPGLVVKGGDLYQKVVSSNPGARYWMDIFHIYLL